MLAVIASSPASLICSAPGPDGPRPDRVLVRRLSGEGGLRPTFFRAWAGREERPAHTFLVPARPELLAMP